MRTTGEKDYYSKLIRIVMKNKIMFLTSVVLIAMVSWSCRNAASEKEAGDSGSAMTVPAGMIPVGSNMITDVILRPDSLGDPWELEKVKGFDANAMFRTLLDKISSNSITVYSPLSEEPMKAADVKKITDEFDSDIRRIAKMQFCEDWYFDPSSGNVVRKTRSIILGYEVPREQGLPTSYKAMFMIKP